MLSSDWPWWYLIFLVFHLSNKAFSMEEVLNDIINIPLYPNIYQESFQFFLKSPDLGSGMVKGNCLKNIFRTWLYLPEHLNLYFLLFLVLEKKVFLTSFSFFEYTSTGYSYFISPLLIWIMSTKCSIPLIDFLYHVFL